MPGIDQLVEQRIRASQEQGDFDNLPGQGKPLQLDDDSAVPAELRTGYRLLKNAGFLPPELEMLQHVRDAEALLQHLEDGNERVKQLQKISALKMQLARHGHRLSHLVDEARYREKLLEKIS